MAEKKQNPGEDCMAEKKQNPGEEPVSITLFKDSGRYKDDVYVSVSNRDGGENCLIQRGKMVNVKQKFAQCLQDSMEQDASTAELISSLDGRSQRMELSD